MTHRMIRSHGLSRLPTNAARCPRLTDVVIETDDGTSKIVVVTPTERIPLTSTATSDDLQGKAEELRAFFRAKR